MGDKTKIEWAEATWNPVTGCTKISEGCKNCYAERIYERFHPGQSFSKVRISGSKLEVPKYWKKPRRIFVCSMSDLFHEDVPLWFISDVFNVIKELKHHTFIVLTKRPERMMVWINSQNEGLPDNLWLGVTTENQKTADERIPILLRIPAKVRFVSCEPLLEEIEISGYYRDCEGQGYQNMLDWVICGGETGPSARPMNLDWARSLRDQCQSSGVPFFYKKDGNNKSRLLDGREWNEYPKLTLSANQIMTSKENK